MRPSDSTRALRSVLCFVGLCCLLVPITLAETAEAPKKEYRRAIQDPERNNLVHPEGYKPGPPDTLGRVDRVGEGKQAMILIAGNGFDGEIFTPLAEMYKDRFTSYLVTLAGFSGTPAPPMPPAGTSYAEQTWTRGAQKAVERLIDEEKLDRPVIVGSWMNGTQIALRLALEHPEKIRGAIVISGIPKTPWWISPEPPTLEQRIQRNDEVMAPKWFKTVTEDTWYDNNFLPRDLALHPVRALQLWRQGTTANLATNIRYFLEVRTQDVTLDLPKLKIPVLAVVPGFDEEFFAGPHDSNYMRRFCQEPWQGLEDVKMLEIATIPGSRAMIMDDKPTELQQAIDKFLAKL